MQEMKKQRSTLTGLWLKRNTTSAEIVGKEETEKTEDTRGAMGKVEETTITVHTMGTLEEIAVAMVATKMEEVDGMLVIVHNLAATSTIIRMAVRTSDLHHHRGCHPAIRGPVRQAVDHQLALQSTSHEGRILLAGHHLIGGMDLQQHLGAT